MDFKHFFQEAIKQKASDLYLVAGSAPTIRVSGNLVQLEKNKIDDKELQEFAFSLISPQEVEKFKENKELDVALKIEERYFRVNFHYQERRIGLSARLMPAHPPKPEEIDFDEILYKLTHLNDGLVLVTGPSGVGKSTTLATMIDIINKERRSHIITIEDPIEFHFEDQQSLIEQRELNYDTKSFAEALKYSLRQDPNVIMLGEMRDKETVSAALKAAETGHLVLSTLHTATAVETVSRIVSFFPSHNQERVLSQLASTLRAVISQDLLPRKDGGRVAAREIMVNNSAISNLIKTNQMKQIYNVIEMSREEGMITMNKYIEKLYEQGMITEDVYNRKTRDVDTQSTYY